MAHRSDSTYRLSRIVDRPASPEELVSLASREATVWTLLLPEGRTATDAARPEEADWIAALNHFSAALPEDTVVCLLTTPPDAAALLPILERNLHFQLWVAVKKTSHPDRQRRNQKPSNPLSCANYRSQISDLKLSQEISNRVPGRRERAAGEAGEAGVEGGIRMASEPVVLPSRHAALLILTRRRGPLRHSPTRIAYTYCPACDRTTKDYGGKKHLYHEYGTLMSDVWRDIVLPPGAFPEPVLDRLQDLLAVAPYRELRVVDLRETILDPARRTVLREAVTWPRFGQSVGSVGSVRSRSNSRRQLAVVRESQLVRGDCLKILPRLRAESVDFCFADPPYNIRKTYTHWNDSLEARAYFAWCDRWLSELARVLKPGGTLAVLNIPRWAARHFEHLARFLKFQAWIAWEGLSLPIRKIMPAHYAIVCFSKGTPRLLPALDAGHQSALERESVRALREHYCLRPGCVAHRREARAPDTEPVTDLWWDLHRLKHNSRRDDHPCQLPPALMRRLIALFTRAGEVVLDPFNGIGTTTLAAAQLGRRYIGIELSKEYHATAKRRHALLDKGGDPFAKRTAAAAPRSKNSRVQRLTKQKYAVTKKTLQLDVKRIAREVGRIPTREDVREYSPYPMDYFEKYFIDWGEVTAAARTTGMNETRPENK